MVDVMNLKLIGLGCGMLWLGGSPVHANRIYWYALAGNANQTQNGMPMGGGFNFELGAFKSGFAPTLANRSQWAANWVAKQRVPYAVATGDFGSLCLVEDNISPFSIGAAAWVWGFQGGVGSSEWILYRQSTWTWPAPDPMNPNPIFWNTANASALIGQINTTGDQGQPVLMRSATVTDAVSPPTSWTQWQAAELAGEPLNGPLGDPDLDGVVNLLEYVFGTSPKKAGAPIATPVELVTVDGQDFLQIRIPRRPDHPALLTVQVSSDLIQWASGAAVTQVIENSPAALVVRDLTPVGTNGHQRFMRLQADLP